MHNGSYLDAPAEPSCLVPESAVHSPPDQPWFRLAYPSYSYPALADRGRLLADAAKRVCMNSESSWVDEKYFEWPRTAVRSIDIRAYRTEMDSMNSADILS